MATEQRAPTSKLLELIRTGGLPQKQETPDGRENAPDSKPAKEVPTPAKPYVETERRGSIAISSGFYKVPNIVDDQIVGELSMAEEVVYRHMIRLSWGWNRNWCRVGTNYFLQKSSLKSRKGVKDSISRLIVRKLIAHHVIDGKIDRNQYGTVYIVPLPDETSILPNSTLLDSTLQNSIPAKRLKNGASGDGTLPDSTLPDSTLKDSILSNNTPGVLSNSILQDSTPKENPHEQPIYGGVLFNSILPSSRITDILTDISKDTLSLDQVIMLFYRGIKQTKISKEKRERAKNDLKEMLDDGFSLIDIQFAIKWTVENAKEELYDFSIIKHTIGQAMAAKAEADAKEARKVEIERIASLEHEERQRMEEEREKVEAHKQGLAPEERAKLREKAQKEIRSMDGIKEEFVSEVLIEAKENEILKAETQDENLR